MPSVYGHDDKLRCTCEATSKVTAGAPLGRQHLQMGQGHMPMTCSSSRGTLQTRPHYPPEHCVGGRHGLYHGCNTPLFLAHLAHCFGCLVLTLQPKTSTTQSEDIQYHSPSCHTCMLCRLCNLTHKRGNPTVEAGCMASRVNSQQASQLAPEIPCNVSTHALPSHAHRHTHIAGTPGFSVVFSQSNHLARPQGPCPK